MLAIDKTTEFEHKIQTLETQVKEQSEVIAAMRVIIKQYEEKLFLAKRRQFGSSSEPNPNQLSIEGIFNDIFNEAEEQADPLQPEPVFEEVSYKRKKRVGKRKDDLSGLPVERIDYELPESERACPKCGDLMQDIG